MLRASGYVLDVHQFANCCVDEDVVAGICGLDLAAQTSKDKTLIGQCIRIVGLCREQGVPEPVYETTPTSFEVEFTRESSKARPSGYSLKEGQLQALAFLEEHGRITNAQYQELAGVKKRQATNDLTDLERRGIVERAGTTGRGTYYVLRGPAKGH